jgi:hypothetical protein
MQTIFLDIKKIRGDIKSDIARPDSLMPLYGLTEEKIKILEGV